MVEILPDDAPAPRLCHLIKWPDFDGYGFNLHAERSNPGQFIGKIDDQSPAQLAGLREGDRIIEVNGVNISNENHRQVVERIKSNPQEARLLVVDAEADAWYREQDLVVKSSQINVVYIKTPVPRPEPDSPRATNFHNQQQQQQQQQPQERQPQENGGDSKSTSNDQNQHQDQQQQKDQQQPSDSTSDHQGQHNSLSGNQSLNTSDFNEESMEQHEKQTPMAAEEPVASRISPPMSPDSGRGDEEQHQPPVAKPGETLTVEAEINHRRPPAEDQISKQSDDHDDEEQERKKVASEQASRNKIEALTKSQMDEKEQIRKLHNKSVDSGKSSSPDATSSSSNTSGSHSDLVAAGGAVEDVHDESGDATTTVPSPSSNGLAAGGLDKQREVRSETEHSSEQPTSNHVDVTTVTQHVHKADETQELRNEIKDTQVNNNNNNNNNKVNLEDSHNEEEEGLPGNAMTKIVTSSAHHQKQALESVGNANNNNYSGLNLNMTASQMRELIASRKKFDPKKAQMNIRQKYEIIQQM